MIYDMNWFRTHWPAAAGVAALLVSGLQAIRALLSGAAEIDFLVTRINDPGWIGVVLNSVLNPPSYLLLLLILVGFGLLFWDARRSRATRMQAGGVGDGSVLQDNQSVQLIANDSSLTVSERIRKIDDLFGNEKRRRSEIARAVGRRYQHVRNVLEARPGSTRAASPKERAPLVHAAKSSPLIAYVERIVSPVQIAKEETERDRVGLLAVAARVDDTGAFDPTRDPPLDLGVVSRLSSLGYVSYDALSSRMHLSDASKQRLAAITAG